MLRSVRARLTLWYTAILALVLITFSGICYALLAQEIRTATDDSLADTAREFAGAFANDRDNGSRGRNVLLDFHYSDRQIMVLSTEGEVVASSRARLEPQAVLQIAAIVRRGGSGLQTVAGGSENDGIRVIVIPLEVLGKKYSGVVAQDLSKQADRLERAASAVAWGIPLALVVAAAGGYLLARKSLGPVTSMSAKARQISAETLAERIVVDNEQDELGFLATTLNDLLERLQHAFESQRSFMADASHELRTPLSVIQGEADVALARRDRPSHEYRESIEIIQKAAGRLTRIVQNLFLLARADAGSYPMTRSRFYFDELLSDCVRAMRSVATAKGVALTLEVPPDLIIHADEELLHRMLLNLVDNAVKFTPAGGRVDIGAVCEEAGYVVRVSDTGSGIPPAEAGQVFNRFFRGDRVRRRLNGNESGAGLGLPIARWIAEAHGGTLLLERSEEGGSTFVVSLPTGTDAACVQDPGVSASV
jgi:two-component system OmpR family sensor kinase